MQCQVYTLDFSKYWQQNGRGRHTLSVCKIVRGHENKQPPYVCCLLQFSSRSCLPCSTLPKLRWATVFRAPRHATNHCSEKPPSDCWAPWRQVRSTGDSNQQAWLLRAQVLPADLPLSKTALGVAQRDLIVLLVTTVSVSVYFKTRVSCSSRNSWYFFLKPKIRSVPYSKPFYFTWVVHQRYMTR